MKHLDLDPHLFDAYFDRKPFYVTHRLGDHPLFSLQELAALATRLPPTLVEADDGQTSEKAIDPTRKATRTPAETILQAGERPAAVTLRQVQNDPRYRQLLDELLDEVQPLAERIRPGMCRREGFIFVSSCKKVTPFHFDPEHNFLLQVRGHKTVYMWDPNDRFVLSERSIEDAYLHPDEDYGQKPPYDDRYLPTAWVLGLDPGQGLNFPLHAPHWVRTESDVAISFSITFRSDESRRRQLVHAANGQLRRLGVPVPAFGKSSLWDTAAYLGSRTISSVRDRVTGGRARPGQPG